MPAASRALKELFLAALEIPPTNRATWLDGECADPLLRSRLEQMLAAHDAPHSLFDAPGAVPVPIASESKGEAPDTLVGPYKLLEQIGEGGMGTVWMAEQQEPIRRQVAIKVVKAGMDSRQVLARFEAERQALARMDHPNIARVLDAGSTATGRPFFAMELVRGTPITKYCDDQHFGIHDRLALFADVCRAVQHAHQKGIIHRDLKPSNVLVASYDGQPVVKVIDFGVAKATGQHLTDATYITGFGAVVGTPEYMSPEQAEINNQDIDTRSDIYSLGVLLYELLTGSTPLTRHRVKAAALLEVLRVIREEEPPKPSTRLSSTAELPSIAAQRQTEPAKLTKQIRGELDWIVMKALEKDRNRRYETANGFAADVQRFLADEPVQACPPSTTYRFRKFARRNKTLLAGAGVVLLFLLLLGGGARWYQQQQTARRSALVARQHETERAVTAAVTQAETLLAEGDKQLDHPERWQATARLAQASLEKAQELLEAGVETGNLAARIDDVRAAVRAAIDDSRLLMELERIRLDQATVVDVKANDFDRARAAPRYRNVLGNYGLDLALPEAAAERVRRSRLKDPLLAALEDWSRITLDLGERGQLDAILDAADLVDGFRAQWRAAVRRRDGMFLRELANNQVIGRLPTTTVCNLALDLRNEKEWTASQELLRTAQARDPGDFWLNHYLGLVLLLDHGSARAEEAVGYFRAALALRSDSPGTRLNLGFALKAKGDLDGAMREYQAALRIDKNYCGAHVNLGRALHEKGDLESAIGEYRAALEIDANSSEAHFNFGRALYEKGDSEGAIREYSAALQLNPQLTEAHYNLANIWLAGKDLKQAIAAYRAAIQADPNFTAAYVNLGIALNDLGDFAGAVRSYRTALEQEPRSFTAHCNLGTTLQNQGNLNGAIQEFRLALEIMRDSAEVHCNLGQVLMQQGDFAQAVEEFRLGHELGSKNPRWPYPSAEWLRNAERLAALDVRLPKILEGESQPTDPVEQRDVALLCQWYKKRYAEAARWYGEAFALQPELADRLGMPGGRYDAARAAALAGCGQGPDADKLDDMKRARLREQAHKWLRAELAQWIKQVENGPPQLQTHLRSVLENWQNDNDLASVRGPTALANLPADEQAGWRQLWAEIENLLTQLREKRL